MNGKLIFNAVGCLGLLFVLSLLFTGSIADASSYQKTDGTIVDPIRSVNGPPHRDYSGIDLEPNANLYGADLTAANHVEYTTGSRYVRNVIILLGLHIRYTPLGRWPQSVHAFPDGDCALVTLPKERRGDRECGSIQSRKLELGMIPLTNAKK